MKINENRLKKRMDAINNVAITDEGGMMRLALSDADKKARDLLVSWMEEEGLEVRVDDLGSMYGTLKGKGSNALPLCIGSHMDTQPSGGRYDGFYGVMAGLEAICAIKDAGIELESDLTVINWTNEEGARFVPPMLASGVISGQFERDWVYDRKDTDGIRYEDELIRIGYKGAEDNRMGKVKAYLEPHIEQGPVLDAEGYQIGIVTGALGITGLDVTISGEANHAGTTPMSHRKDAMIAAAKAMLEMKQNAVAFGEPAVITNGTISIPLASKNVVPGTVHFSVDMRYNTDEGLDLLERQTREIIEKACIEQGTRATIERYWKAAPVRFDPHIVDVIRKKTEDSGCKARDIISGAGHDAVFISNVTPTGMIFVPSVGGMSHCPQENTKWDDLVKGTELLADVLVELDK